MSDLPYYGRVCSERGVAIYLWIKSVSCSPFLEAVRFCLPRPEQPLLPSPRPHLGFIGLFSLCRLDVPFFTSCRIGDGGGIGHTDIGLADHRDHGVVDELQYDASFRQCLRYSGQCTRWRGGETHEFNGGFRDIGVTCQVDLFYEKFLI